MFGILRRRAACFTLIELLVVIAIIAVLTGMLLPALIMNIYRNAPGWNAGAEERPILRMTDSANYTKGNGGAGWYAGNTFLYGSSQNPAGWRRVIAADLTRIDPTDTGTYHHSHRLGSQLSEGQNTLALDLSVLWYNLSDPRTTKYQDCWDW